MNDIIKLKNSKANGFTIVELLIVIVVIGILAAITIVSYSGVTSRANTAANQSNANSVQQGAEAVFAENNAYPTSPATIASLSTGAAKLPAGITLGVVTPTAGVTIMYTVKTVSSVVTGYCLGYWNYTTGAPAYLYGGSAVSWNGTACV